MPRGGSDEESRLAARLLDRGRRGVLHHRLRVRLGLARWVVSVDPHEGYPAHDPRPTLDTYLENLRRNAVTNVVPVIGRWQDALDAIRTTSFDVVFMDLTGRYEDTKELLDYLRLDFATGLIGAIAVHDCGHPDWPGVQRAVEEFHNETGVNMTVVDRLAVFQ